jgi:putative flavoprotein involved in K+ transport
MNNTILDVIVVGAGHAGLSASYYLKSFGLNHLVLERGKVGESWRSQRWNSFMLNSPNKLNTLPGDHTGKDPDGFSSSRQYVFALEDYVSTFQLPVLEDTLVLSIEKNELTGLFDVTTSQNNRTGRYQGRQVIIASGSMNEKSVPSFAGNMSSQVQQLHGADYRHSSQLADGAVLVAGSGQSGVQIAADLAAAGRKVYLATSMVPRVPRRYRGKDIMDWLTIMNFFEARKEDIKEPGMQNMRVPQLTGVDGGQRTISLQSLAKQGVTILGKIKELNGKQAVLMPNAAMHIQFADGFSKKVKEMIDGFIMQTQMEAPAPEIDEDDMPDTDAVSASPITTLDFSVHNIRSVIWTTGFKSNFNYLKLPVFDADGNPKHKDGIADVGGLYFLGLSWLRKRKSVTLVGIKEDAAFIAQKALENIEHGTRNTEQMKVKMP